MDTGLITEVLAVILGPVLVIVGYHWGRRVERERGRLENEARVRRRRRSRPRAAPPPADGA